MSFLNRVRRRFIAYAKASQIHGFSFIASAGNCVELFFWTVAVVASIAMFTRDVINLAQTYQRQDTTISLSISTDPSIVLPKPTFCVDVHRESVITFLGQVWNSSDDFNAMLTNQTCSVFTLLQQDDPFWIPTYLLLTSYMDADLQINQTSRIGPLPLFYSPILDALETCIEESGTDLFELVPAIGMALCQLMNVQMFSITLNDTVGLEPCAVENVRWVGPRPSGLPTSNAISGSLSADVICFSTPFPMFEDPTHVVSVQTNRLFWNSDKLRIRLFFDPNGGECVLKEPSDCQYFTATSIDYLNQIGSTTPVNSVYSVALSLTYTALNRTTSPCSMESTFDKNSACVANTVERERGCAPLSFFASVGDSNSSSIAPCTMRGNLSQYGVPEAWNQCSQTMPPACETVVYKSISSAQMDLTTASLESVYGNDELSITIMARPAAYSAITEDLMLDSNGLIAALGGSMIAWFGGSVICFVHIVVFIASSFHGDRADQEEKNAPSKIEPLWLYFAKTPIHGLPFANDGRQTKAIVIFWLLVVATGIALAIRDTLALVATYNAQPTEVDIEIDYDAIVSLDELAVCFTISRTVPDLINRPLDGDASGDLFQSVNVTEFAGTLAAFAESSAMAYMQADRYDLAVNDFPLVLTVRLYLYLSAISDYDKGVLTQYEATMSGIMRNNEPVDEELALLDAFVSENKLDLFAITKLVASSFCLWINPTLTIFLFDQEKSIFNAEATNLSLCSNLNGLTWFGSQPAIQINRGVESDSIGDKLCYSLAPFVGLLQDPQHDYLEISLESTELLNGATDAVQLLADIEFDLRGGAGVVDSTFADGTSSDSRQIVTYENMFSLQNRSTKICASIDRFSCAMSCAAEQIVATRKCVSIAFPRSIYNADQLKLPTCTTYQTIENTLSILTVDSGGTNTSAPEVGSYWSECLAECAIPCETETYKFAYSAQNANPNDYLDASTIGRNYSYSMAIKRGSSPCWHFTERLSMDLQTAIWSFGGSLGLWIGASFMALLHLPLYCLSVFMSRRASRKQQRLQTKSAMTTNVTRRHFHRYSL